jgi:hypothetical protein
VLGAPRDAGADRRRGPGADADGLRRNKGMQRQRAARGRCRRYGRVTPIQAGLPSRHSQCMYRQGQAVKGGRQLREARQYEGVLQQEQAMWRTASLGLSAHGSHVMHMDGWLSHAPAQPAKLPR